jgi:hypothetical protein
MNVIMTILGAVALLVIVAAVMSLPVMLLWDWLMPVIFGLPTITWFQAWGLLFLCGLLFKNHTTINRD